MKRENIVIDKAYQFAVRIVKAYQFISKEKSEYVLSKQLLRSGTSIGANIHEAQGSISKREFIAKIHISYKEAFETRYWLHLLKDTQYMETFMAESLLKDNEELIKILTSIIKSSKS